jgi:hypothetical protein
MYLSALRRAHENTYGSTVMAHRKARVVAAMNIDSQTSTRGARGVHAR